MSKLNTTGLYILPQAVTSLEGRFIDGNVTAHLNRVKKAHNVELETLSVMTFLEFNPSDREMRLKQRELLEPFFRSILKIEDGELFEAIDKLTSALAELAQQD